MRRNLPELKHPCTSRAWVLQSCPTSPSATALGHPVDHDAVARSYRAWVEDTEYTCAICEQTSVEMLALARLHRRGSRHHRAH